MSFLIVELELSQVPILHDQKDIRLFRPAPTLTSSVDPGSAGGVAMPRGVVALMLILAAADRGDAASVAGWFDAASASVGPCPRSVRGQPQFS